MPKTRIPDDQTDRTIRAAGRLDAAATWTQAVIVFIAGLSIIVGIVLVFFPGASKIDGAILIGAGVLCTTAPLLTTFWAQAYAADLLHRITRIRS